MRVVYVATLAVLLLAAGTATAAVPLDAEGAANPVVERIIPELAIASDYAAFLYAGPIDPSDELAPYAPTPIPSEVNRLPYLLPYELTGPTWFLWIDLQPHARYAHDTLFVLIDATDGTYAVHAESWWPALNGASLWVESDEHWDEGNWVASLLSAGGPMGKSRAACEADVPGSDYYDWALVVSGWSSGQPGETSLAADARGVCEALNGLGMRVSVLDPGEASPEAFEAHVIRLFTEIPLYKCCGRLYSYIAGHSSPGALWIGGHRLSSLELTRMLTFPGGTYVPSRVYVMLEAGYGGSFIPDLSPHGNIHRVWTASAVDEPAYADLDPTTDPNPEDSGGEWTSSFLATMAQQLREDPLVIQAIQFGREYMPLNMAFRASGPSNAAAIGGLSRPSSYLFSDNDPEDLLAGVEYLARWDRAYHRIAGNLDEIIARYEDSPCLEVVWFLNNMARHDALGEPTLEFNGRIGKGHAKDLAHSDWWELCDLFWEVFTTPDESEWPTPGEPSAGAR